MQFLEERKSINGVHGKENCVHPRITFMHPIHCETLRELIPKYYIYVCIDIAMNIGMYIFGQFS